jgi:hypothetical protein
MSTALIAAFIAVNVGFGVFRSCTAYAHIRTFALCIDALFAGGFIWLCSYMGWLP